MRVSEEETHSPSLSPPSLRALNYSLARRRDNGVFCYSKIHAQQRARASAAMLHCANSFNDCSKLLRARLTEGLTRKSPGFFRTG